MMLVWCLIGSSAFADAPSMSVVLGGPPEENRAMREVLAAVFEQHGVEARFEERSAFDIAEILTPRAELGRVFVDLSGEASEVRIYVADGAAERILVRSVAIEGAGEIGEVTRETAASIVDATVEALVAGVPIGRPRAELEAELGLAEPPPPIAEPPPVAIDPTSFEAAIEIGYRAALWIDDAPLHGPGLALLVGTGETVRIGARVGAWLVLPVGYGLEVGEMSIVGGDFRLEAVLAYRATRGFSIGASIGVAAGFFHTTARAAPPVVAADPFVFASYRPTAGVELRLRPLERLAIRLAVTVEADVADTRFVVLSDDNDLALDPFLLWPAFELAVGVRVD
jgi:hypothetical protein